MSFRHEIKPTPTPLRLPYGTITDTEFDEKKYLIFWIKVPDEATISLIANFSERIVGEKLAEANNCDLGINGGYYLDSGRPLGLFINNEDSLGRYVKSSIADAFVWQDKAGDLKIVRTIPQNLQFTEFIFQTGPYIKPANRPLKVSRDEYARRSLLGKDFQGNLYLISVTSKANLVDGPKLGDIPIIFWQLKQKNLLSLEELINLDGGSASFFFAKDNLGRLTLTSWAPVGSLMCVKLNY